MKYTTLFFDLDDTLWDTAYNSKESLGEIYTQYKIDSFIPNFDDFYNIYLPCNTALWAKYAKGEITKDELIVQRFTQPFEQNGYKINFDPMEINRDFLNLTASKSKVIDNTFEILELLHPHYQMHILSNGFTEVQYKKLENSKLSKYFDKIILSDQVGVNKPHPSIFDYALDTASAKRETSVMIGDSWASDIVGAKNSNIDQIWFNPDSDPQNGFAPTHTIGSLLELKTILC